MAGDLRRSGSDERGAQLKELRAAFLYSGVREWLTEAVGAGSWVWGAGRWVEELGAS